MSDNTVRFLIGFGIPFGISAVWFWLLRSVVSPGTAEKLYYSSPMKYVTPTVMLAIIVLLVIVNWTTRRWISYGALATLVPMLAVAIALVSGGRAA